MSSSMECVFEMPFWKNDAFFHQDSFRKPWGVQDYSRASGGGGGLWGGGWWSTLLLEKALFPPPTLSSHLLLPHILSSSRSWVSFPTEKLHSLQNGGEGLLLIAVIHFKRAWTTPLVAETPKNAVSSLQNRSSSEHSGIPPLEAVPSQFCISSCSVVSFSPSHGLTCWRGWACGPLLRG